MFQIRQPSCTVTRHEAEESHAEGDDGNVANDDLQDLLEPLQQEENPDDLLPDLTVRPPSSRSSASTSTSSTVKKARSKSDDVLVDMVQRLSSRRPVLEDIREAIKGEKVDRRTAFCNYLGSEAREFCEEDWLYFQRESFKVLQSIRQRVQNRAQTQPDPQPQPQPQPQQYQQQHQQQQQAYVFTAPQGPSAMNFTYDTQSASTSAQQGYSGVDFTSL